MIRQATRQDLGALAELMRTTFSYAYAADMPATLLAVALNETLSTNNVSEMLERDVFHLYCIDKKIVGFIQAGNIDQADLALVQDQSNTIPITRQDQQIRRIYFLPAHQNLGYGKILMQTVINPGTNYLIDVWYTNNGAQRFYQRLGFETVAKRPEHDASGNPGGYDYLMYLQAKY